MTDFNNQKRTENRYLFTAHNYKAFISKTCIPINNLRIHIHVTHMERLCHLSTFESEKIFSSAFLLNIK